MMKISAVACAMVAAVNLPTAFGWWDNGHMLVGQVATQLMSAADVTTINSVLALWGADFVNTSTITTAAVWPDLIKCTSVSSYCASKVAPSLDMMETWHYIDLPYYTNGSGNTNTLDVFANAIDGDSVDVLEKSISAFSTTKSTWSANFVLRNFIHIFGDAHQPLHTTAAVNSDMPTGDAGGNLYKFASPCAFSNLHALWDAGAGAYSGNDWGYNLDLIVPGLKTNATELIALLKTTTDAVNMAQYASLTWSKFASAMVSSSVLRLTILDSYSQAANVYGGLDLTLNSAGKVPCPSASYVASAVTLAKKQIALGGQRLAVILTQIAKQLRTQGLAA